MSPQDCWAAVSKLNLKTPNTGHLILVLLLLTASGRRTGEMHAHACTSTASYLHKAPLCKTFWCLLSSFKGHGRPDRQTQRLDVTATHKNITDGLSCCFESNYQGIVYMRRAEPRHDTLHQQNFIYSKSN